MTWMLVPPVYFQEPDQPVPEGMANAAWGAIATAATTVAATTRARVNLIAGESAQRRGCMPVTVVVTTGSRGGGGA
ncbi:hypothetical protein GCM10022255_072000 [Dactylosporangium darangshiense]|uniref:Uncharacterized protein n=1 Tax=Dactylosporangium darangshiense TaxID=579108 RepID=A0ABP8DIN5_9ACTN